MSKIKRIDDEDGANVGGSGTLTAGGYVNGYKQRNKDRDFSESRSRSTIYSVIPCLGKCPKDSIS